MLSRGDFPKGFVLGTATAAYQIEGHAFGGAGPTHWDSFAATPGNVAGADDGARACDHYHRWDTDLDLVKDAGLDAYRFSVSWPRVLPTGAGAPNPDGVAFYDRLIDEILARGLAPWATLYHWELPSALADSGGWQNRDTAARLADFGALVADRFGDRLTSIATVNEPWCVAWLSHFLGIHAPGLRDIRAATRAMHHILLAHGLATQALRAGGANNIGLVVNMEAALPASDAPEDRAAAARQDAIMNRAYVEPALGLGYPAAMTDALAPHLPAGWQDDMAQIAQPLDWLGLNYYTRSLTKAAPGAWPAMCQIPGPLPKTAMGWEIYPQGLTDTLLRLHELTGGGLPLYVTENGMASDEGTDDASRIAYLTDHIAAARTAMAKGADLRGYFIWSLLDNYEWAEGYAKRFGLVHVDFESLQRTPKASYRALAKALRTE